jgi:Rab GDP dissociation inhibitor
MGTGVTESILSGLMSLEGHKILHVDSNGFYGGEGASLNLTNLWEKFLPGKEKPKYLGENRD